MFSVRSRDLGAALTAALPNVDPKCPSSPCVGVLVRLEGDTVTITATDRYTLARVALPVVDRPDSDDETAILVPLAVAKQWARECTPKRNASGVRIEAHDGGTRVSATWQSDLTIHGATPIPASEYPRMDGIVSIVAGDPHPRDAWGMDARNLAKPAAMKMPSGAKMTHHEGRKIAARWNVIGTDVAVTWIAQAT